MSLTQLYDATDPEKEPEKDDNDAVSSVLSRFTSPIIDDRALPISDVVVAQVIAPSLQVFWLSLNHAPTPTWLVLEKSSTLLFQARGSLVAPALIHGAALGTCWIVGALAARAYERAAIAPVSAKDAANNKNLEESGYGTVVWRVVQAGAFSTGLLIMATQLDLLFEFGRWVQPGESEAVDLRLLTAAAELINDVFFEAVTLLTWRLFLARQTVNGGIR